MSAPHVKRLRGEEETKPRLRSFADAAESPSKAAPVAAENLLPNSRVRREAPGSASDAVTREETPEPGSGRCCRFRCWFHCQATETRRRLLQAGRLEPSWSLPSLFSLSFSLHPFFFFNHFFSPPPASSPQPQEWPNSHLSPQSGPPDLLPGSCPPSLSRRGRGKSLVFRAGANQTSRKHQEK